MPDLPDLRLTIRRGAVLAVDWHHALVRTGPLTTMLRERERAGVGIADATVIREGGLAAEAVVAFVAGDTPPARAAIVRWAGDVGYRRLWLPGDVVELRGPQEAPAETRCSGCAVRLHDAAPEFWRHVRALGRFPSACPVCGGDLPQWRVRQNEPAASDPEADHPPRTRRTPCT
jgi:hypothetical protein